MTIHNFLWTVLTDGGAMIRWAVLGGAGVYSLAILITAVFVASALLKLFRRMVPCVRVHLYEDKVEATQEKE